MSVCALGNCDVFSHFLDILRTKRLIVNILCNKLIVKNIHQRQPYLILVPLITELLMCFMMQKSAFNCTLTPQTVHYPRPLGIPCLLLCRRLLCSATAVVLDVNAEMKSTLPSHQELNHLLLFLSSTQSVRLQILISRVMHYQSERLEKLHTLLIFRGFDNVGRFIQLYESMLLNVFPP